MIDVSIFHPTSLDEAVELAVEGWLPLAGGTDIVPRLSFGLLRPANLLSVGNLPDLAGIRKTEDFLFLGSTTTLNEISDHPFTPPWLRDAVERTANRIIRNRATLGGNLLQGRRCRYYNRPAQWREASGHCRRIGGSACFAGESTPGCSAGFRSLIAAVLIASGSMVYIRTPSGIETTELHSLYQDIPPLGDLRVGGLITAIAVPMKRVRETVKSAVLTRRASLDYPEIAIAIRQVEQDSGLIETTVVMTAPLPRPSRYVVTESIGDMDDHMVGWLKSVIPTATTGLYGPDYLRMAAHRLISRAMRSSI